MSLITSQIAGTEQSTSFPGILKTPDAQLRTTYNLTLEKGEDGWIIASCIELHTHTQGKTEDAAIKNAIEAIQVMIDEDEQSKEFSLILHRKFSE